MYTLITIFPEEDHDLLYHKMNKHNNLNDKINNPKRT